MVKRGIPSSEWIVLGMLTVISVAGLWFVDATLSGQFVFAGGRVHLTPKEACENTVQCKEGPALILGSFNTKPWSGPPQVTDCICPEYVTQWEGTKPVSYPPDAVNTVRLIKNYNELRYTLYE